MEIYRGKLTDEMAQRLVDFARKNPGVDLRTLANLAGIAIRTMQRWMGQGLNAKKGKYFDLFVAIQKSRDETTAFIRGRHQLLATGGILRSPATKTHYDEHRRPFETNLADYDFSEAPDKSCKHERRIPERPDTCADCNFQGRVKYVDRVIQPSQSALEFHIARLDPVAAPAQQVDHQHSGHIAVEHSQAPMETWIERMGEGYRMLKDVLHERHLVGVLDTMSAGVPGVGEKSRAEVRKAIERIANKAAVETVVTVIPDKTDFIIEMSETEDGTGDVWEKLGEQTASTPESACRGFLLAYCHGRLADKDLTAEKKRETVSKLVSKFLPRVRAVPKT